MNCKTGIPVFALSLTCIVLFNSGTFPLNNITQLLSIWAVSEPGKIEEWKPTNKPNKIGEWKTGLRFKQTCRLPDSTNCCNRTVKQLHFEFKNNDLNREDILDLLRTKISGKNITIFGDSLQGQLTKFMAEVLNMSERTPRLHYFHRTRGLESSVNLRLVHFYEYGTHLCKEGLRTGKLVLKKYVFLKALSQSDIMILNLGLHYSRCNTSTYRAALEEVAGLLREELTRHPHKQVIFRSTLPQHFSNGKRNGGYFRGFNKDRTCYGENYRQHWSNKYMKEVSKRYGFKFLDSFPIYADRWDLHFPDSPVKLDCTHFCFTPETIIPELTLLEQILPF